MARCGCAGSCSCYLTGINQAVVSGNGTVDRPYVIDVDLTDIEAQIESDLAGVYTPTPPAGSALGAIPMRQADGSVAWQGGGLYSVKGDLLIGTGAGTSSTLPVGSGAQSLVTDSTTANGMKWARVGAPKPITADPGLCTAANTIPAGANRAAAYRVMSGGGTISNIGLIVAVASGNIGVAVYRDNGSDAPGTLVAQSGSKVCPAAPASALVALGSSVRVDAGDWLAIACDNTTATFRSSAQPASNVLLPTWRAVYWTVSGVGAFASNPTGLTADNRVISLWGA